MVVIAAAVIRVGAVIRPIIGMGSIIRHAEAAVIAVEAPAAALGDLNDVRGALIVKVRHDRGGVGRNRSGRSGKPGNQA